MELLGELEMRNEKLEIKDKNHAPSFLIPHSSFSPCLCAFVRTIFAIILFSSCAGLVQKSGEIVEGSAFNEMKIAAYSSGGKSKETKIELFELKLDDGRWVTDVKSSEWPGLTLRGGMPAGNGSYELHEARILSSHYNGWNDFNLDLIGTAFFINPLKSGGTFRISGDVERVQISSGRIRLKGSRLTGNAALTALRNRRERILALCEWMNNRIESEVSAPGQTVLGNQKEFEKYWKPLLFPELVSKSRRPQGYVTNNADWRRADSVKWNLTYTKEFFDEGLWEYRNSGAMLRDWEEALPWIFMEYNWDSILESFNDKNLIRIK